MSATDPLAEIREALLFHGLSLRAVSADRSVERIKTEVVGDELVLRLPPGACIEDAAWHAARAVGRLAGFPSDIEDIQAQALLDSWAYELCRSGLARRPALLQSRRIRRRLESERLLMTDRWRAAYALWSVLTVLDPREREIWLGWLAQREPRTALILEKISARWGFQGPGSPAEAAAMLQQTVAKSSR